MSELNLDLSVSSCLSFSVTLSVFFFPSVSFSVYLFWPFVSEQLCGCAYIMCNPAGQ